MDELCRRGSNRRLNGLEWTANLIEELCDCLRRLLTPLPLLRWLQRVVWTLSAGGDCMSSIRRLRLAFAAWSTRAASSAWAVTLHTVEAGATQLAELVQSGCIYTRATSTYQRDTYTQRCAAKTLIDECWLQLVQSCTSCRYMRLTIVGLRGRIGSTAVRRLACAEECSAASLLPLVDSTTIHLHPALHSRLIAPTQQELQHGE